MKNLIIGILLVATPAMSGDTFAVGTAVAQRGAVAYGALDVPAVSDAATSIPVIVVNGASDGPVVAFAGTIVDLHGGDLDEDLVSYSYWMRGGKAEQDAASRALTLAFGLDRIIVNDVDLASPAATRSLSGYALSLGKSVVVAEAGASGRVESEDVAAPVDGSPDGPAPPHKVGSRGPP